MTTADKPVAGVPLEGHVFVSYARRNQAFVNDLVAALERHGEKTWIDRDRIPDAMKWMQQIRFAIVDARACIFIISEQAVESEIWNAELNEALRHGKRLVPVIIDNVVANRVPEALRELQWTDFRGISSFDEPVRSLIRTISKNPEWVLAHTRFAIKSAEWNRAEGKKGSVLRGTQLKAAAGWLESPDERYEDPSLTDDQVAFIQASLIARKRRIVGTVVAMAFGLALAVVAVHQYRQSELGRQIAAAQSIAATADEAFGQTGHALQVSTLLAVQSIAIADTEEGRRTMLRNLALLPEASFVLGNFGEAIRSLAFSPDGKKLLVGTETGGAKLCDVETLGCTQTLQVPGYVRHVEFSEDGRYAFTAGANAIVWDLNDIDEPLLSVGDGDAQAYAVSPNFEYVAIGDQYGYGEIRSVANGERSSIDFDSGVFSLAFNEDGKLLASGDSQGKIRIWEVPSGDPFKCRGEQEQLQWSHGQRINALAFVPRQLFDHSFAAGSGFQTGGRPDNATRIWQMCVSEPAKTIQHENQVQSVVFTDDGKLLASVSLQEVIISEYVPYLRGTSSQWNVGRISIEADAAVRVAAFVPAEHSLATGWAHSGEGRSGGAGTVLVSRPAEQANPSEPSINEVQRFALDSAPRSLAFSKDASHLATGEDDGTVRIWPLILETSDSKARSAMELMLEGCRKLPSRVRSSIVSGRHWQLPISYQSNRDPCELD